jgi:uncharacterized lipoprotein YddW (UPF0748 family)
LKTDVTGIHLDCIGFPRSEYCTCKRCVEKQQESNLEREEWRSKTITEFIGEASKIVKEKQKSFSVTILPDPCFGKQRYGEDFHSLAKYVDFFLVPLYDLTYSATYWLETIAYGFHKQLEKPLYIELYAANPGPKLKKLLAAMNAISNYVEGITLATHDNKLAKKIQNKIANDKELTNFLNRHGSEPIQNIANKWKENFPK